MVTLSFSNKNSQLTIETGACFINYNGFEEKITKSHVISKESGKIETNSYIIKWSGNNLFLYDKLVNIILLEKMQKEENLGIKTFVDKQDIVLKYYVTKDIYVNFHEKGEKYYIEHINKDKSIISEVIDITQRGSYKVYMSKNGDTFQVPLKSTDMPKFNNILISRIS